ncbi:MAG: preprotein translocase subunit YajC [Acetivibrionales bacterium]|jgi:preprotein translocase subunit YajC
MQEGRSMLSLLLPFIIMIGAMYLLIFLPQKKREKKAREMLSALKVGDNIITIGGIAGKIVNIKDDEVTVETSVEKTKVNFKKWAVKEVIEEIKS